MGVREVFFKGRGRRKNKLKRANPSFWSDNNKYKMGTLFFHLLTHSRISIRGRTPLVPPMATRL